MRMPFYLYKMTQRSITDQLQRKVEIHFPPQRIVSLVPSQTELLADLGLESQVVGITRFCVHPEHWRKSKTLVGGTKNFNFEVIRSLNPDLIIGNKEENYKDGIDELSKEYPVWMSHVVTLPDALEMIQGIGKITGTIERALDITNRIERSFRTLPTIRQVRVLYLIWKKPWMAAGSETFINTMLELTGFQNVVKKSRYPELTVDEIRQLDPDFIFLSSEPYPFSEKHREELQGIAFRAKVILVDGEIFSWYGSRLLRFPDYINRLIPQLL